MANKYTGSDTGKAGLEVKKTTGTPDVRGVTEIQLDTNLTLTDNGNGGVTIQSSGGGGGSGVTSVGLTGGGSALTITNSPITTSGDINIAGAGSSSQVILGDLSLGTHIGGSLAANQIAVGTAANTIGGSSSLQFSEASGGITMTTGVTGNDPSISLSSNTKALILKVATNEQLTVVGGMNEFVFDASSATGGITWPDGTTQITAANGTVSSVGLTGGGSALIITNSPITTSGDINIAGAGLPSQVILGNLGLGTLPTPANPTATIGATADNGTATTTFMRSDAAPALETTGVTAATYGSSTTVGQFSVDATGRITSAANVSISGGGGGGASPIFSKHFGNWGSSLQLLQDRNPGSGTYQDVDVVNLNDFQYFTPFVDDQFADVGSGSLPEVKYEIGGDNNPFATGNKNITPFSLTPGQTFRLTTGIDTSVGVGQINYSLEEYNTNVFGGALGDRAGFIVNPAFLGTDGSASGTIFTKIILGCFDATGAPIEDLMYEATSMGVIEIMYIGNYSIKGETYDIFMVSNQGLLGSTSKPLPLLQGFA